MKKDIKIIALDLDGTTFNEKKEITPRTRAAFRAALDKGVIVMPATGRPLIGLPKEFIGIEGVRYALTSNGALVFDLANHNKVLYKDCIPVSKSVELLTEFFKLDAHVDTYNNGQGYASFHSLNCAHKYMSDDWAYEYILKTRIGVDDLPAYIEEHNMELEKINMFFADLEERERVFKAYSDRTDIAVSSALGNNIEVNNATANKGAGLLALGNILGIRREQIMVCGDGGNDIEMLKAGGFSVAMGNARKEVKEVADYITKSNEEDGVAYAIEQFVL